MNELEFLFVLLVAAAGLVRVADLIRVPYPIVLVLGGLAIGFIPGLPDVELAPDVVFLVFLPPLLVAAGYYASPQELLAENGALAHLSLAAGAGDDVRASPSSRTSSSTGCRGRAPSCSARSSRPPTPSPRSPPSARARVPERVRLIVEGEAMINDATALVAFRVAVGVATGETFDAADAALEFVVSVVGGIAVGLAVGWVLVRLVERLADRPLTILAPSSAPTAPTSSPRRLHVSGVLGAVLCGLYLGWHAPRTFDADVRLSAQSFWEVLEFIAQRAHLHPARAAVPGAQRRAAGRARSIVSGPGDRGAR